MTRDKLYVTRYKVVHSIEIGSIDIIVVIIIVIIK